MPKSRLQNWADSWKRTSVKLNELRKENIQHTNSAEAILSFDSNFKWAVSQGISKPTSGMVEMQRLFMKLHKK